MAPSHRRVLPGLCHKWANCPTHKRPVLRLQWFPTPPKWVSACISVSLALGRTSWREILLGESMLLCGRCSNISGAGVMTEPVSWGSCRTWLATLTYWHLPSPPRMRAVGQRVLGGSLPLSLLIPIPDLNVTGTFLN